MTGRPVGVGIDRRPVWSVNVDVVCGELGGGKTSSIDKKYRAPT